MECLWSCIMRHSFVTAGDTSVPRRMFVLCTLTFASFLTGCAQYPVFKLQPIYPPADKPIWDGGPTELTDPNYFDVKVLRKRFRAEIVESEATEAHNTKDRPFEVGLALAGGGAKAASYSMGVLQSLYFHNILQREISVISTVSGGGYAALWYYSRLSDFYLGSQRNHDVSDRTKHPHPACSIPDSSKEMPAIFCECIPYRYSGLLDNWGAGAGTSNETIQACPSIDNRWLSTDKKDSWRFQNHLRGFSDILSNDFQVGLDDSALGWDVAKGLGLTFVTLPGHWVTNLVFDWRLQVSPTQKQYKLGIERTFGLAPVDLSDGCGTDIVADDPANCNRARPVPNRLVGRGVTFATLQLTRKRQQEEYEWAANKARGESSKSDEVAQREITDPRVPLLVVNTTAGVSRTPFDLLEEKLPDFEDSVFEFTPAGYGSRLYGYWPGSHPEVDVATSVTASAAFFDSQQRNMGWFSRLGVGMLLRTFQLDWGVDIANPSQPDRQRGRHSFLPFPLYFFNHQTKNPDAPYIHLSDGGQSDNTGIFSLVRRGVEVIIYADAAQDQDGRFEDLCVLRFQLKRKLLYLNIPSLTVEGRDFAKECDAENVRGRGATHPYDLWKFKAGFLEGCITRNPEDVGCTSSDSKGYKAALYILKPSIDLANLAGPVTACIASQSPKQQYKDFEATLGTDICKNQYRVAVESLPGLPIEVFGFLVRNWNKQKDNHPIFPQHSTWKMTLNSSAWLYGAYRALGNWHTEQLLASQPWLEKAGMNKCRSKRVEKKIHRTYLDPVNSPSPVTCD